MLLRKTFMKLNSADFVSGMHIAIRTAAQTVSLRWWPQILEVDSAMHGLGCSFARGVAPLTKREVERESPATDA